MVWFSIVMWLFTRGYPIISMNFPIYFLLEALDSLSWTRQSPLTEPRRRRNLPYFSMRKSCVIHISSIYRTHDIHTTFSFGYGIIVIYIFKICIYIHRYTHTYNLDSIIPMILPYPLSRCQGRLCSEADRRHCGGCWGAMWSRLL